MSDRPVLLHEAASPVWASKWGASQKRAHPGLGLWRCGLTCDTHNFARLGPLMGSSQWMYGPPAGDSQAADSCCCRGRPCTCPSPAFPSAQPGYVPDKSVISALQDDDIPGIVRYRTYEVLKEEVANPKLRWAYLPYSMHMAGPREAIQHMIIRRNYGGFPQGQQAGWQGM